MVDFPFTEANDSLADAAAWLMAMKEDGITEDERKDALERAAVSIEKAAEVLLTAGTETAQVGFFRWGEVVIPELKSKTVDPIAVAASDAIRTAGQWVCDWHRKGTPAELCDLKIMAISDLIERQFGDRLSNERESLEHAADMADAASY